MSVCVSLWLAVKPCRDGDVQLANNQKMSGAVEVCVGGLWKGTCADSFVQRDAAAVCKLLKLSEKGKRGLN